MQLSAITIGNDVGADTPSYAHGSLTIDGCTVNNIDNSSTPASRGFRLYGDNITVSNCTFEATLNASGSLASEGVFISSKNGVVRDCTFIDSGRVGASLRVDGPYQVNVKLIDNDFSRTDENSPIAIQVIATDGCGIRGNTIADGGQAIDVSGNKNIVNGNTLVAAHTQGTEQATVAIEGTHNRVTANTIEGCGPSIATVEGIRVHSTSIASDSNVVSGNVISNLQGTTNNYGLTIVGSVNGTDNTNLSGNHFDNLDRGLSVSTGVSVNGVHGSGNSFSSVTTETELDTATNVTLTTSSASAYGAIYLEADLSPSSKSLTTSWTELDPYDSQGELQGVSAVVPGNGYLQVSDAGKYAFTWSLSGYCDTADRVLFRAEAGTSGSEAETGYECYQDFDGSLVWQNVTISGIVNLTANQRLRIAARSSDAGTTLRPDGCHLVMWKVG